MPTGQHDTRKAGLGQHPVRTALLELLHRDGIVTATSAADQLGGNTGQYSFHLRRLAEYGVIEEVPAGSGRVRPWRLAGPAPARPARLARPGPVVADLNEIARGLEDESYHRWLEHRHSAPEHWQQDEAFSQVLYLTPDEMVGLAKVVRALMEQHQGREATPAAPAPQAAPVAFVIRLFPLLGPEADPTP